MPENSLIEDIEVQVIPRELTNDEIAQIDVSIPRTR